MKLPFLTSLIFAIAAGALWAGAPGDAGEFSIERTVPLNDAQRAKLRDLIAADPEAAQLFTELKTAAQKHLELEPDPLQEIHYEGLVNTDSKRIAAVAKLRQMSDAAILFQYWQASGDPRAADTLRRLITAWASTYKPTGNDVNENKLYPLFTSYEGLRPTFDPAARTQIDDWIGMIGEKHADAIRQSSARTNRFTKSVRLVALFGRTLGRKDWTELATGGLKDFVTHSLRPDGTSLDLERRDTLTYHSSALRPMIDLAIVSGKEGADLYTWESPDGASLEKSVDYVVPYADGSKTRREWENTTVALDRERAAAGLEEYRPGRLYEPKDALRLVEEASYFDPGLMPLALALRESKAARFASWTMVVNAAANAAGPR